VTAFRLRYDAQLSSIGVAVGEGTFRPRQAPLGVVLETAIRTSNGIRFPAIWARVLRDNGLQLLAPTFQRLVARRTP